MKLYWLVPPTTTLEAAQHFARLGLAVVPIPYRQKRPVLPGWQHLRLNEAELPKHFNGAPQNIGVILGDASGQLVDVDVDAMEAVHIADYFLPDTCSFGRHSKRKSHRLFVAKIAKTEKLEDANGGCLVEIRSNGGQTVFPPSTHDSSGESIYFTNDTPVATIDAGELQIAVHRLAAAAALAKTWPQRGSRSVAAMALAGGLLRAGWSVPAVEHFIEAIAVGARDEEAAKRVGVVGGTAAKLGAQEAVTGWPKLGELVGNATIERVLKWLHINQERDEIRCSDLGNAERLARLYADRLRHVGTRKTGRWHAWDGKRWAPDADKRAWQLALDSARSLKKEAIRIQDADEQKRIMRHAWAAESEKGVRNCIALATVLPAFANRPEQFDQNPDLLVVENGTIELATGQFRDSRPEDWCTRMAGTSFEPQREAPQWDAFLRRVLVEPELIDYVQRAVGYSLSGHTKEHTLFFLYGGGSNGKSTFTASIHALLGDYAKQGAPDLLLQRRNDTHPTELADLFGARFVLCQEVDKGKFLREATVKQLTGGDRIKARYMHKDFFEFAPTHKIWLCANVKPELSSCGEAMRRRVRLIPFTVTIPEAERDTELVTKLRQELPGILNWALAGYKKYQEIGLAPPAVVRQASDDYLDSMDTIGHFLNERCQRGPTFEIKKSELYDMYQSWCVGNGVRPESLRRLSEELEERGIGSKRYDSAHYYTGVTKRNN